MRDTNINAGNNDCDNDLFMQIADLLLYQHTMTVIPMMSTNDNLTEDTKEQDVAVLWY